MSQVGTFFLKIFFLDSQHADLAPLADSREVASLLLFDREAGVRKDNLHCACTCFFRAKARWNLTNLGRMCWIPGKPDRKNAWALLLSLLLYARAHISRSDFGMTLIEGYGMAMQMLGLVHSNSGCQ